VSLNLAYSNRDELTSITRYKDLAGTQLVGTTAYSYDNASRVTSIVNKNGSNATLSYYNYTYNGSDWVASETHWSQVGTTTYSGTRNYSYDGTGQLTSDGTTTYSYDANGNRTMSGYQTATGNRLTTDGSYTYTYDAAGNEIGKQSRTTADTVSYTYDNANRLTSVVEKSDGVNVSLAVTYAYDVSSRRVEQDKWATGGTVTVTRFAYDGQNVWADLDGSNNILVRYLYGGTADQILARVASPGQPNAGAAYYLVDRLGSVRDLADNTSAVQDHMDYNGFGNATESNASFGDRYKFTGREFDGDTGLQYNRARYLDPRTGRWMAGDPLGFASGDNNLYRYVKNSPTNATDSTGTIGVFFDGTLYKGKKTNIAKLQAAFVEAGLPATPVYNFSNAVGGVKEFDNNVAAALKAVLAARKKNPNEPVYLFGYSRGGYAALVLAKKLQEDKTLKNKDVNFVEFLDASSSGLSLKKPFGVIDALMERKIPDNIKKVWIGRTDGGSLIVSIFWDIEKKDKRLVGGKMFIYGPSHFWLGFSPTVYRDMYQAALDVGIPLKKLDTKKKGKGKMGKDPDK
jgi:RHS repeat-associated protein